MNVKIEKLVYGGEGLAHHEGQPVFVPFVLPEEVVSIRPVERKKKFVRGRLEQVLEPSPERSVPTCPHFGVCGGCHYQHMPYDSQLRYKAEILRETLRRIGRVDWTGPIQMHASSPFGYRNRVQWAIAAANGDSTAAIGYHQPASSALCDVQQCPILTPRLADTLAALRRLLAEGRAPETLREVEAFADASDARLLVNAAIERFDAPAEAIADRLRSALPAVETLLLQEISRDRFELFGPGYIHYQAGGHRYRVGHLSFFQVNRFLIEELIQTVVENERGALALDLFAGVGLFTAPLAARFERVVGVEYNPAAARDLQKNLEGASTADYRNADATSFLASWRDSPDLVVLDPPRAGVPQPAIARLAELGPQRITYLSCEPSTLARDLEKLIGGAAGPGPYEIREVHLFDVFPQTYHIESLMRLARRE